MLLTNDEIKAIDPDGLAEGFARAIESAVLEKLKAQKPVGVFAYVNRLTPEAGTRWEQMVDEAYDGKEYIHLYRHPLPPADVVRDAERYQFIKSGNVDVEYDGESMIITTHDRQWIIPPFAYFDAAIDAAMENMK